MPQEDPNYKTIKQKNLVRILKDNEDNNSDTRFTFLLGAGASIKSGIHSALTLSKIWLREIKEDYNESEYASWVKDNNIDEKHPATNYSQIYKKRFENDLESGYIYLQKIMENIEPSLGYSILSQILVEKKHNFVITTNFDSLIEDSLFLFTSKRPLVCGHESLSGFIKHKSTRPTIIKAHRDILLDPHNKPEDLISLSDSLKQALNPILLHSPTIVIGYGGYDESIMNFLKNTDREAIYWCLRNTDKIPEHISEILTDKDKVVEIEGFDELMLAINATVYNFDAISTLAADNPYDSLIVKNAIEKAIHYKDQLEKMSKVKNLSDESKENLKTISPSWLKYELDAQKEENIDKKQAIYKKGLEDNPSSPELLGSYALFLNEIKKDYNHAQKYYKKALLAEPNHAINNGNYAIFLEEIEEDFDGAELYYKKALEINPNNANTCGNYALFLENIKKDFDGAEKHYVKALEIDANHTNTNGNYAVFLEYVNKDFDGAEIHYKKALELEPNHANNNGNYALFLNNFKEDFDKAEIHYKKALELEPNNPDNNGNYTGFLLAQNKKAVANKYFEIAFKEVKNNKDILCELWFYKLAHYKDEYKTAIKELDTLLEQGHKSEKWDFSHNIEQAIKEKHSHINILKDYAYKISGIKY